ncbi:hypothetical protein GE09DRAFT_1227467 [Coniochaeta sp. 2T2.1]|nr:hypothetical protein GE09DRAFT_1227467 [Coniochaeta sp. 2T2.1]
MISGTFTRVLVAPLNTTFAAPQDCSTPFNIYYDGDTASGLYLGYGYWNCGISSRSCLPGTGAEPGTYTDGGYYSPGLYCPEGYETKTTVDSNLPSLYSELSPGETAVLCCPSGRTLLVDTYVIACTRTPEPQDDRHYFICRNSKPADTSLLTTYTEALSMITTYGPIIQINWRASDLATPTTAGESAPTAGTLRGSLAVPPLATSTATAAPATGGFSTPQLAGVIAGGVIGALLIVGGALTVFIRSRRRRMEKRNTEAAAAAAIAEHTARDHGYGKAELEDAVVTDKDSNWTDRVRLSYPTGIET